MPRGGCWEHATQLCQLLGNDFNDTVHDDDDDDRSRRLQWNSPNSAEHCGMSLRPLSPAAFMELIHSHGGSQVLANSLS